MIFKDITLSDASTEAKVEVLGAILDTKFTELASSVSSVEKQIGPKGDKGDKGDKGERGLPGVDGKDGKDAVGIAGKDGKDGLDGEDGADAPKIVNAEIALDDTLLITLSDGSEIKTNKTIVGPQGPGGVNGMNGQPGATGPAGVGVPVGGTVGQALVKIDGTDYNTQWATISSGGFTELDPVYAASSWYTTTNNSSNWNTAYGWGNHASAGYLTTTVAASTYQPIGTYLTSSSIGTTVQAYDADLTSWAAITPSTKQDTLVSGTNIKTINSTSLLGTGNIAVGTVTSVTGTAPVVSSGGTTPAISMAQATSLVSGYLSSTDWSTFNNKQPAGTYATGTGTASGTNTGDETNATIKTKLGAASTSTDGYLTSTDWNTFNGKGTGTVTSVGGTGTVSGLTLTGSVTNTGNLTLGGTLSATASNISDFSTAADARIGAASINALSDVVITTPANTQVLTYNGTNWVNAAASGGGGSFTGGTLTSSLILAAGTATAGTAPLEFVAGPVNTVAEAGAVEYDGNTFYSSVANSTRGVVPSEQMVVLTSNNTLTSQTAAQPIFDGGGGPAGGAVTLPIGTYVYETSICITGMSATSGSFGFVLGGTATKTYSFSAQASKAGTSLTAPMAMVSTCGTAAITTLVANSTGTVGQAVIRGAIRVTVAGTVIPQISLTVASAAVIQANGYFKVSRIGNATVATIGNWS